MEVIIKKTKEEASQKAFEIIKEEMENGAEVLGLATGSTPEKLYDIMVASDVDFSNMVSVNLDEYVGLAPEDPQSYHYFMQEHLFNQKPFKETYVPDGLATDEEEETARYEGILKEHPIDVQILGVGTNGHIGFNEPGSSFDSVTRKVKLVQSTIDSNKRYFEKEEDVPKYAYSMGIKSIMRAKKVLLMAFGENKAEAVKGLVGGPVTEDLPGSVLQQHPDAVILLDEDAASLL
ncbi:glucosamine-6-phosphate deaminase [Pisciglobus halotolerans]|uniref:Glucosamine-6-phosphate deaminase n=1 Tax=Pisciglobus halotolerans TaxID=745365 RepID=A0A1I3BKX9_9LACT|nr:glucosamine-6-phosphate deaminase [Pisciglobus halotolerans]SFH62903.1 glucosamine-6-phosphate deaminase [Pisciglobus halotolerans]